VSDAGLAHFKDCKKLAYLYLGGAKVSDAGLAYFKDCKNLTEVLLNDTLVSDEGVTYLKDCRNLKRLNVKKTKVTAAAVEEIKKALPGCRIEWDGGVIEPIALPDPDRRAAEYVLSIGGTLRLNDQDRVRNDVKELPREAFRLTAVELTGNKEVSDAGLAVFKDCKNLTVLQLGGTPVGDAGLANFKDCTSLTRLDLGGTKAGDAGLAHFAGCKNVTSLSLWGTRVGDEGLAHFKDCKNMTTVWLDSTEVRDAGLRNLAAMTKLEVLYMNGKMPNVTNAGIEELKKALPGCRIERDGGATGPK
jgi:hypothetical protein